MSDPNIGEVLRRARKLKKVSLHEASWETRIRVDFLEKMEQDNFRFMTAPAYVRGLLRSYSAYLDLNADAVVNYFDETHAQPPAPPVAKIAKIPREPRFTFRVNWVMAATTAAVALLILSVIGLMQPVGQGDVADAPDSSEVAGDLGGDLAAPTPETAVDPPSSRTEVAVELVGEKSWLLVIADGKEDQPVFEGTLTSGEVRTFEAEGELRIVFGDLGSVRVSVNGRDLGILGQPGEVGNFIFSPETTDFTRG
jgi:cytoskeletal protein RodZ